MKKMLITGAGGFLGCRAADYFRRRGYCLATPTHREWELTDPDATRRAVAAFAPDYVLHCAAVSDTRQAEEQPALSYAANVQATANLAAACAESGAKLVYLSSDQVYFGCTQTGPLSEALPLTPANVYGRQKYEAEQRVAALLPGGVGLRLTWLYDLPTSRFATNKGLLLNLAAAAASGSPVAAPTHEHRGITSVWAVIERLPACFELPGGVYNFGCGNPLTTLETYRAAAKLLALPETLIRSDEARFAAAPRNLAMDGTKLAAAGVYFPDTVAGIAAALAW